MKLWTIHTFYFPQKKKKKNALPYPTINLVEVQQCSGQSYCPWCKTWVTGGYPLGCMWTCEKKEKRVNQFLKIAWTKTCLSLNNQFSSDLLYFVHAIFKATNKAVLTIPVYECIASVDKITHSKAIVHV